ncbi:MAG: type IV secretion system protein [Roseburia sp.]|nr:type IV secretion system protein [Roseburia sp.]MCM1278966.1 type IV secretion system protein [Robinsoniella sp.]
MWCPVCKNEYKEGILRCADCGVDLVEQLTKEAKAIYFGELKKLETINAFLKENGIESGNITFEQEEQVYELSVLESDQKKAVRVLGVFLREEEKEGKNADKDIEEEKQKEERAEKREPAAVYVDKRYKADEYKTSAYTLFFVGILGIVFLVCMGLGILPFFQLATSTKIMMYVVLGALFAVFLGFGVYSMKAYKKILAESLEEEGIIKKVEEYLNKTLTKEAIKASLTEKKIENENPEDMYFEITAIIEAEMKKAFPDLEEALLAKLTEDHYTRLYE